MITRSAIRLAVAALVPACATADVILERIVHPGYVEESHAISSHCTISDTGQVATEHRFGSDLLSHGVQQRQMTVVKLRGAINEAMQGSIRREPLPVDVETRIYRAYKRKTDGSYAPVLLWEENGGSGDKRINEARAAAKLKNFIDVNCGV